MGLRVLGLVGALSLCAGVAWFAFKAPKNGNKYIFINETSDHRFDESIRISIMAAAKRTGVQNAIIITDRLVASDLEQQSSKLFSDLRVGEQQHGRGILYLFSPAQQLLKIEVGYALEGVLPDSATKSLERAAKAFIYRDRYQDFWAELINTLNIEISEKENGLNSNTESFDFFKFRFLSGGAGIAARDYDPSPEQLMREFRNLDANEEYPSSAQITEATATYLKSLHAGIGDPKLDVLSTESRVFRAVTPLTTFQLFRNWRMYTKAGIDRVFEENALAFVFFKSNNPVLPIVLKRVKGKWRVHEPMSWSLFHRFEDSSRVFLKFPLAGVSPELTEYMRLHLGTALYPLHIPVALTQLQNEFISASNVRDLYYQLFWLSEVQRQLGDSSLEGLWIAADTYLNLGQMSKFASFYEQAAKHLPLNKDIQANAKFYRKLVQFTDHEWRLQR